MSDVGDELDDALDSAGVPWRREGRPPTVGEARDYFDAHATAGGDGEILEECERVLDATDHPARHLTGLPSHGHRRNNSKRRAQTEQPTRSATPAPVCGRSVTRRHLSRILRKDVEVELVASRVGHTPPLESFQLVGQSRFQPTTTATARPRRSWCRGHPPPRRDAVRRRRRRDWSSQLDGIGRCRRAATGIRRR